MEFVERDVVMDYMITTEHLTKSTKNFVSGVNNIPFIRRQ